MQHLLEDPPPVRLLEVDLSRWPAVEDPREALVNPAVACRDFIDVDALPDEPPMPTVKLEPTEDEPGVGGWTVGAAGKAAGFLCG